MFNPKAQNDAQHKTPSYVQTFSAVLLLCQAAQSMQRYKNKTPCKTLLDIIAIYAVKILLKGTKAINRTTSI